MPGKIFAMPRQPAAEPAAPPPAEEFNTNDLIRALAQQDHDKARALFLEYVPHLIRDNVLRQQPPQDPNDAYMKRMEAQTRRVLPSSDPAAVLLKTIDLFPMPMRFDLCIDVMMQLHTRSSLTPPILGRALEAAEKIANPTERLNAFRTVGLLAEYCPSIAVTAIRQQIETARTHPDLSVGFHAANAALMIASAMRTNGDEQLILAMRGLCSAAAEHMVNSAPDVIEEPGEQLATYLRILPHVQPAITRNLVTSRCAKLLQAGEEIPAGAEEAALDVLTLRHPTSATRVATERRPAKAKTAAKPAATPKKRGRPPKGAPRP